jgi:hypothetical protein
MEKALKDAKEELTTLTDRLQNAQNGKHLTKKKSDFTSFFF